MPHLYPSETLTYMKRQGTELPPMIAVMTDYTCIPFWEETRCDAYIVAHEEMVKACVKRGIPEEKLIPAGIPVSSRFSRKADKQKGQGIFASSRGRDGVSGHWRQHGSRRFGKTHRPVSENQTGRRGIYSSLWK